MRLLVIILLYILVILLFLFFVYFKWIINTIRDIASPRNQGGYTKLIQVSLTILLSLVFVSVIIYYFLNPSQVDRIDIILTVVVGWLGLIIGRFFGEKAMETLEERRQLEVKKVDFLIEKYNSFLNKILKKK